MKNLQRTVVAIGVLDLAYVAWIALATLSGGGARDLWQSTVAFGLPYPELQIAGMLLFHLAILACGVALILRRPTLAWINVVLFPLRILLGAPTLFPVFVGLAAVGMKLPLVAAFALLAISETVRVVLVWRWARAARTSVGAAATA